MSGVQSIGVRELRQHASTYLDRVKAGESFEVTERGTPVAMLVPTVEKTGVEKLIAEGRLIPTTRGRSFPRRGTSRRSSAEILDAQRAERRMP